MFKSDPDFEAANTERVQVEQKCTIIKISGPGEEQFVVHNIMLWFISYMKKNYNFASKCKVCNTLKCQSLFSSILMELGGPCLLPSEGGDGSC